MLVEKILPLTKINKFEWFNNWDKITNNIFWFHNNFRKPHFFSLPTRLQFMQKFRFKPFKRRVNAKSFHSPPIFTPKFGNISLKLNDYTTIPPSKNVYFCPYPGNSR